MKEITPPRKTLAWGKKTLAAMGHKLLQATALRVEASNRSFYRIRTDGPSLVLMESPPALERNNQFITLAQVFNEHGIPVPEIVAQDQTQGWFLLTDMGDVHLQEVYRSADQDAALTSAIDTLTRLAAISHPAIEPYTRQRLQMELALFEEWFMQGLLNRVLSEEYAKICDVLILSAVEQPKACVHRDYHCRNLLFTDGHLGIVDFQDALHGPILYDIASLLRDCYFEFSEHDIDRWLSYFVARTLSLADKAPEQVKTWFDFIAIQRQLKALGIFSRLHLRDRKSSHLTHILPVLGRLQRLTQQYPELAYLNTQLLSCNKPASLALAARQ